MNPTLTIKTNQPFTDMQKRLLLQPESLTGKEQEKGWEIHLHKANSLHDFVAHLSRHINDHFIMEAVVDVFTNAHYSSELIDGYLTQEFYDRTSEKPWMRIIQNDLVEMLESCLAEGKTFNLDGYCTFSVQDIKQEIATFIQFLDELIVEEIISQTVAPFFEADVRMPEIAFASEINVNFVGTHTELLSQDDESLASLETFDNALFPSDKQTIFADDALRIPLIQLYSLLLILGHAYAIKVIRINEALLPTLTYLLAKYEIETRVEAL